MNARGWDGRAGVGRFIAFRPGRATCRGFERGRRSRQGGAVMPTAGPIQADRLKSFVA